MADKKTNYSWQINPATGDYVTGPNGDAVIDATLATPIYIRLKTPLNKWLYAPDSFYGSTLGQNQKNRTAAGGSTVGSIIFKALTPMRVDGRMVGLELSSTGQTRHGQLLSVIYQQNNGHILQVDLPEIL